MENIFRLLSSNIIVNHCKFKVFLFKPKMQKLHFIVLSSLLVLFFYQNSFSGETLKKFEQELQELIFSNKESIITVRSEFSHKVPVEKENGLFSLFSNETVPELKEFSFVNIGTGVIFDKSGHIITRSSIVLGSLKNEIVFANGMTLQAEFVGDDPGTGFAVIKVDPSKLVAIQPAKFSDSTNVNAGSWNFIMGNAFGVYPAIVIGTVNGVREDGMIQISANLSPGNNGSPIINLKGEVIGLVAGQLMPGGDISGWGGFGASQTTMVYPCNWVRKVAEDIIAYGYVKRGWLGVVGYYDGEQPKIGQIKANSPAQKAGLEEGDIVLKFSGRKIKNISHFAKIVESTSPGRPVKLEFMRAEQIYSTEVELAEKRKFENNSSGSDSLKSQNMQAKANGLNDKKSNYQIQKRNQILAKRVEYLEQELEKIKQQLFR